MHRTAWIAAALILCLAACRLPKTIVQEFPEPEWSQDWEFSMDDGLPGVASHKLMAQDMWLDHRIETPMVTEPERAVQPDVSRDGKLIVYARRVDDGTWQIFKQDLTDEGANPAPTRLSYTGANHMFPRISPDGKWVAFASDRNRQWDIFVTAIDSPAVVQQITNSTNDEICPSWSPDGRKIAYCYRTMRGYWQLAYSNRSTRVVTTLGAGIYPDWHPSEDWLTFQSQPGDPTDYPVVSVVRTNGRDLKTVAEGRDYGCVMPRWSDDGEWVVYASFRRNRETLISGFGEQADDVWMIRPNGMDRTQLSDDPAPQFWPTLAKGRVFFVSWSEGNQVIISAQLIPAIWKGK